MPSEINTTFYRPIISPYNTESALNLYGMTLTQLKKFFKYLNSTFITNLQQLIYNDVGRYVLNYMYYPFDLRVRNGSDSIEHYNSVAENFQTVSNPAVGIKIGNLIASYSENDEPVTVDGHLLNNSTRDTMFSIQFGSIDIEPFFNNFLDFAPFTSIYLYIPFSGEYEIDVNKVMGKTLTIDYYFDILTGKGESRVSANNRAIATYPCTLGFEIPLVYDSFNNELKGITEVATKIGMAIGSMAATSSAVNQANISAKPQITTTHSVNSKGGDVSAKFLKRANEIRVTGEGIGTTKIKETPQKPYVDTSTSDFIKSVGESLLGSNFDSNVCHYNSNSGTSAIYANPYARLTIKRPQIVKPENYNHTMGVPCAEYVTLGSLTGFTKVGAIHLENFTTATENEVSEIYSLLNDGVIF